MLHGQKSEGREGKVMNGWAVVTGASSGIGEEFASELARRSSSVLAVARQCERLDALAKQASAQGGRIESLTANLGTESGVGSVLERLEELGEIELLINNAGLANADDFVGAPLDHEVATIKLNIEAVLKLTHGALQSMTRRRHGRIINVAVASHDREDIWVRRPSEFREPDRRRRD